MKHKILAFVCTMVLSLSAIADGVVYQLSPQLSQSITVYAGTLLSTNYVGTNFASFTHTNAVSLLPYKSQTFQAWFTAAACSTSNQCSVIFERSVDGTNYVPYGTNSLALDLTTAVATSCERTFDGKWNLLRCRSTVASTNSTLTIKYIAQ